MFCRFSKCVSFSGGLTWGDAARLMPCHLGSVSDACHFPRWQRNSVPRAHADAVFISKALGVYLTVSDG